MKANNIVITIQATLSLPYLLLFLLSLVFPPVTENLT